MSDTQTNMVGRKTEYDTLTEFITSKEKGVRILGINGPGGVGKTYLLDIMALNSNPPEKNSTIVFRLNGKEDERNDNFIVLFKTLISSMNLPQTITNAPLKSKPKTLFSETQQAIDAYSKMLDDASKEIDTKKYKTPHGIDDKTYQEKVKIVLKRSLRLGVKLQKSSLILLIEEVFGTESSNQTFVDEIFDLISDIKTLKESSKLPDFLLPVFSNPYSQKIKSGLFGVISETMYLDFKNLYTFNPKSEVHLYDKILFIIDDFEVIGKTFGDFLITFIPKFEQIPYSIGFIILGRDDLETMHLSFKQHLAKYLVLEIALKSFSKEETLLLLNEKGFSKVESEQIYKDTYGYPFLISSIIIDGDGISALQLRNFYARVTRWMSKIEKEWLNEVCYLDVINQSTLKIAFPKFSEELIKNVMQWFIKESSIRDQNSENFTVNPFIRRKILEYLSKMIGPKPHKEKLDRFTELVKQEQSI